LKNELKNTFLPALMALAFCCILSALFTGLAFATWESDAHMTPDQTGYAYIGADKYGGKYHEMYHQAQVLPGSNYCHTAYVWVQEENDGNVVYYDMKNLPVPYDAWLIHRFATADHVWTLIHTGGSPSGDTYIAYAMC